jgi:hypothetical protein
MIYKGIEFNIIQDIEPGVWKWSVSTSQEAKNGQSKTKPNAVIAAWQAIDIILAPKKIQSPRFGRP